MIPQIDNWKEDARVQTLEASLSNIDSNNERRGFLTGGEIANVLSILHELRYICGSDADETNTYFKHLINEQFNNKIQSPTTP